MLTDWLAESVGLERTRAEEVARCLEASGCHRVDQLREHRDFYSLDIVLEEWEAVAIAKSISSLVSEDDIFAHDRAFRQDQHFNAHPEIISMEFALRQELLTDIALCSNAHNALLIAIKIQMHQYMVSYGVIRAFCDLVTSLCISSVVHQQLLVGSKSDLHSSLMQTQALGRTAPDVLAFVERALIASQQHGVQSVPLICELLHKCLRCGHVPCVVAALRALTLLASHRANQRVMCSTEVITCIYSLEHSREEIIMAGLELLDQLATLPANMPLIYNFSLSHGADLALDRQTTVAEVLLGLLRRNQSYSYFFEVALIARLFSTLTTLAGYAYLRPHLVEPATLSLLLDTWEHYGDMLNAVAVVEAGLQLFVALLFCLDELPEAVNVAAHPSEELEKEDDFVVEELLRLRAIDRVVRMASDHLLVSTSVAHPAMQCIYALTHRPALLEQFATTTSLEALLSAVTGWVIIMCNDSKYAHTHIYTQLQGGLAVHRLLSAHQHLLWASAPPLPAAPSAPSAAQSLDEAYFFCLPNAKQIISAVLLLIQFTFFYVEAFDDAITNLPVRGTALVDPTVDPTAFERAGHDLLLSLRLQDEGLCVLALLLQNNSELWAALAKDMNLQTEVINGKRYLAQAVPPQRRCTELVQTIQQLYALSDRAMKAIRDSVHPCMQAAADMVAELHRREVSVLQRATNVLLHFLRDVALHSALHSLFVPLCRLLSLFYSSPNTQYVVYATCCLQIFLQDGMSSRNNARHRSLCQLVARMVLYYSQVRMTAPGEADAVYMLLLQLLQSSAALAQYPVHRADLEAACMGRIVLDLLMLLDDSMTSPESAVPELALRREGPLLLLPPLSPGRPKLDSKTVARAEGTRGPAPVDGATPGSRTRNPQLTPSTIIALLSVEQVGAMRCIALEVISQLCLDAELRAPLLMAGLGRLCVQHLFSPALVTDRVLAQQVLRLLIVLAETNKLFLGEAGVCEAVAFALHKRVPVLDARAVIESVDEDFVRLCCHLICNMCSSAGGGDCSDNKQKLKRSAVAVLLQALMGKFYTFVPTLSIRMDIRDAINAIKF